MLTFATVTPRPWNSRGPSSANSPYALPPALRPAPHTSTGRSAVYGPARPRRSCGCARCRRRSDARTVATDSLSGCHKRNQLQASSTISRRSRRLPALLMPCSRRESPEWYGVGVKPTHAPTCLRLANWRQANNSWTNSQAPCGNRIPTDPAGCGPCPRAACRPAGCADAARLPGS